MHCIKICALLLGLLLSGKLWSQANNTNDTTGKKTITIIHADTYNFQNKDTAGQFIALVGHAEVQQNRTLFYADSIVLNQKLNILEAFGNVHINDADSVQTYSQYLKYLGKEKKAFLKNKVKLTDGKGVLTTNDLEYDTQIKIGKYVNGGKLVNGQSVLTSKEGTYYGDTRDVIFKKNVVLIDPEYKIYTDTLLYNINTNITTFISPSKIINGNRTILVTDGYYDLKNKVANFSKRPFIDDSTYTFTADYMAFNDSTGIGEFQGNAVYRSKDSTGGYDIIANKIKTNRKEDAFLATEQPILLIKQEKDSIYVGADTLRSGKLSTLIKTRPVPVIRDSLGAAERLLIDSAQIAKDTSNNRFIEAYHHVKIFSDSLQAVGDSLFYTQFDSAFRLFTHPIVWSNENQISGDTIYLFLANKKPKELSVFENALTISKAGNNYYNQVRGNSTHAFFNDGKINYIHTRGTPADNIYFVEDENHKFIGVNQSTCSVIDAYFKDGEIQKVLFINDLKGVMSPMKQANPESLKVRGFKWQDNLRPKNKYAVFSDLE
ncbi:OstA-like protein [Hydrotalea sandarakina]|jgi:lipopolysaccharide export system protein LptA|uniref:OstA-like protein n=1 Tax=Hydrotalea sandarakina TaxID=1004304 RepID=UPI00147503FA|nr:OstA-like protein [Hydrotalea sandarakina]